MHSFVEFFDYVCLFVNNMYFSVLTKIFMTAYLFYRIYYLFKLIMVALQKDNV